MVSSVHNICSENHYVAIVSTTVETGDPISEVDGGALYEGIRLHGHKNVTFCEDQEAVISRLKKTAKVGDIILTLGAGNVWRLGETFIQEFKK